MDEEIVSPPRPQVTECLLPQYGHETIFMKPNDSDLIDLASSFDVKYANSAIELKNFAEICLSTRRAFGMQTSSGIEALELKVIQCQMMINKKFPDFGMKEIKTKADVSMKITTPMTMHIDEPADVEEEVTMEEQKICIDFQDIKNIWLDRVEANAKFARQQNEIGQ